MVSFHSLRLYFLECASFSHKDRNLFGKPQCCKLCSILFYPLSTAQLYEIILKVIIAYNYTYMASEMHCTYHHLPLIHLQ